MKTDNPQPAPFQPAPLHPGSEDICPRCGSGNVVPIIYGMPDEALQKEAAQGLIELGGCEVWPGMPDMFCRSCGYRWRTE